MPLAALLALLGWNISRDIRNRNRAKDDQLSTICSTSRRCGVGPKAFIAGWTGLTIWFGPHYVSRCLGRPKW